MLSVDLPVSLKVSFRVSPPSRLTPLKDASCEVVVIWLMMLLYWRTRLSRVTLADASTTGAGAVVPAANAWLAPTAEPVIAPIVAEAASFVVVIVSLPDTNVACRLLAARASFSWLSEPTRPGAAPNTMSVAVPPPVAAIFRVLPSSTPGTSVRAWVTPPARPSALRAAALLLDSVRSLSEPVFSVIYAAGDGRGRRRTGQTVDLRQQAGDVAVDPDFVRIVAGRGRGHEGQRLAVDGEGITHREGVRQRSSSAVADAQLGRAGQSTSRHGATATSSGVRR